MPLSQREMIVAAIDTLEHFRTRIGMYIGHANVSKAIDFLTSFTTALGVCGIRPDRDIFWWKVQEDRGWEMAASGPTAQMEAKGMDVQAIIDELVEIEIEILRRYARRLSSPDSDAKLSE